MSVSKMPSWRQLDAGLWSRHTNWGHVEIAFASASDGSAVYEVTAYDETARPLALGRDLPSFGSMKDARCFAEAVDTAGLGRAM